MPRLRPNNPLVEVDDEKRLIPQFMDSFVVWGDQPADRVVVESFGGVEADANESGQQALGILVDADDHLEARWAQARDRDPAHAVPGGPRIGVWIMPANRSRGMLETFLGLMLAPERVPLWTFAADAGSGAREHGAPYVDAHLDKASPHTDLASIDPPGLQLHQAVLRRALDAKLPAGDPFVKWFMDLYQLPPRTSSPS